MMKRLSGLLAALIGILTSITAHAQTPPPQFDVSVDPPDGSILITETTNSVFVTVNNLDQFTNVTVKGSFAAQNNISFLDDGQPPDQTATNGTFSANIITPRVRLVATNVTLRLVITGEVPAPDPLPDPPPPPEIVTNTNNITYIIVPRPENDNFTNAYKVAPEGAIITATNNYASLEPVEPLHAQVPTVDASVWWTWSSPVNTNAFVDLSGSSFDAVLAVYMGTTLTNLQPVAASTNDVVNGLKAHVNFDAVAGVTYRIAVSGYNTNEVGDIYLRVIPGGQPDTTGPLVTILTPDDGSLFTNNLVTFNGTSKDIQPGGIGLKKVFLKVNGTNQVDATGAAAWSADLDLPPGTNTIEAFAQDIAGNVGPPDSITVIFMNPTNDNFTSAIELTDLSATISAINGRATTEPGEPLHAGNEGGHSIWYSFRAPLRGTLFLSTTNSDFDTLLAVYTGDSLTNLSLVAENDDASTNSAYSELTTTLASNVVYYIAVDGYGGESGNIELHYAFTDIEQYFRLTISEPLGGGVSPAGGVYIVDTPVLLTATPSPDFEFIGWEGDVVSTDNPLTVLMSQDRRLTAMFRVKAYSEGFESGNFNSLPWSFPGATPWIVQSNEVFTGSFAARSGAVGDLQSSSLLLVTTLDAGTGAFRYRVSSEKDWDFLEFYANGVRLGHWSGETPWQTFMFHVTDGVNTLEWRYVKDANFSDGLDAAFIDDVYLPPKGGPVVPELSLLQMSNGNVRLGVTGPPNRAQIIEASTNLADWISISTNITSDGTIQWVDPQPATGPMRYYRVEVP